MKNPLTLDEAKSAILELQKQNISPRENAALTEAKGHENSKTSSMKPKSLELRIDTNTVRDAMM
jgi:hypothetical protein